MEKNTPKTGEKGRLFLIPSPIHPNGLDAIPQIALSTIHALDYFIVERLRTARRFIKSTGHPEAIASLTFVECNKDSADTIIPELLQPIRDGRDGGVLSEAGCPGIADPGARLVAHAHKTGIPVTPLPGPSSIFLALMGSGLSGQKFTFHGYLPAKRIPLRQAMARIEKDARKTGFTQIFMEAPYRNHVVLEEALQILHPDTTFGIAAGLLSENTFLKSARISDWRKAGFADIHKVPAIFFIGNLCL